MNKEESESAVSGLYKDALLKHEQLQEMAQKFLEANRPAFEMMAKHAESVERLRADIEDSSFMRQIQDFVEKQVETSRQEIILSPEFSVTRRQNECDYIVDSVVDRLSERSKSPQGKVVVDLPSDARWESVAVDIQKNGNVSVKYRDTQVDVYDREVLGFSKKNTANKDEDTSWHLLRLLAVLEQQGIPATKEELCRWTKVSDSLIEKRISRLAQKLRDGFGMPERPFLPYDPREGYRMKFTLRPEADLRGDGELHRSGMSLAEEYYKEEE